MVEVSLGVSGVRFLVSRPNTVFLYFCLFLKNRLGVVKIGVQESSFSKCEVEYI